MRLSDEAFSLLLVAVYRQCIDDFLSICREQWLPRCGAVRELRNIKSYIRDTLGDAAHDRFLCTIREQIRKSQALQAASYTVKAGTECGRPNRFTCPFCGATYPVVGISTRTKKRRSRCPACFTIGYDGWKYLEEAGL
ncbi:MAG: hypothetical protein KIG37_08535 [Oscillospiraceae bacterium]|nr:hypothetical protein [Oscillospiraceae bacterium]